jgi:hypothetical protein
MRIAPTLRTPARILTVAIEWSNGEGCEAF